MRNNSTGQRQPRNQRMLNQMNKQLAPDLPDSLKRIKGAATGNAGRINAHAGREPPKGPRGNKLANGVNRMVNGRPGQMAQQVNPAMNMPMNMNPQQTMQMLQMMEQQTAMLAQMFNNPGQQAAVGGYVNPKFQQPGKSMFDRIDKKPKRARTQNSTEVDAEMADTDGASSTDTTNTLCKFAHDCTVPTCPFAHPGPATPRNHTAVDTTDNCSFGAACTNKKCTGRHPSPAQRMQHKQALDCRFYPNCTNVKCPFRHPETPACRFGADCIKPGCTFSHSKIMCRYTPCTNAMCHYKHAEGQKSGKFQDKVWTADGGAGGDGAAESGEGFDREALVKKERMERFASLKNEAGEKEELILPGSGLNEGGAGDGGGGGMDVQGDSMKVEEGIKME